MKGQFVFEFLIAGIIFFAVVLYAMNYLNTNVSMFHGKSYGDRLQSKALQISEILTNEKSSFGLVGNGIFKENKIRQFNDSYCTPEGYARLRKDFELFERTDYGERPLNVNITLTVEPDSLILSCGHAVPEGSERAEIIRYGVDESDKLIILKVVVW